MIKVAVLYLAMFSNKMHFEVMRIKGIGKIGFASFIGTLFEIVGLIFSASYTIFVLCVHLLEIPFMVRFVLGKNQSKIFRVIVSGYFFTMLINSVLEILWNQFGESGGYLFFLLLSCGVVIVAVRIFHNYTRMQKGIYSVELLHKENRLQTKAFYDSGNCLLDPYTKRGVYIVSEQILRKLEVDAPVCVPYQALGNQKGLLEVYYIDELVIEAEKQRINIQNCPLGVTKDNLFENKNYQIILNEEVF